MSRVFGYFVLAFAFIVLSKFAHFAHSTCCILCLFCGLTSSVLSSSRSLFSLLTLLPCRSNHGSDCRCLLCANRIACAKGMQHFGLLASCFFSVFLFKPLRFICWPSLQLLRRVERASKRGRRDREQALLPNSPVSLLFLCLALLYCCL